MNEGERWVERLPPPPRAMSRNEFGRPALAASRGKADPGEAKRCGGGGDHGGGGSSAVSPGASRGAGVAGSACWPRLLFVLVEQRGELGILLRDGLHF